jgi:hypothetical protein
MSIILPYGSNAASWTPVLGGSGGTSGQTYSIQVGTYVVVDRLVTAWFNITLTAKGTITTDCQIQGLPFTAQNVSNQFGVLVMTYWQNLAANFSCLGGYVTPNTAVANLTGIPAAGAASHAQLATASIANNTQLLGVVQYRV